MDTIMETPDRERAILQQRAASAAAVTSFPGQTPDGKELLAAHPHLQHQIKSSPTSASSDSFSSYIHKDAAILQRSSSPRAETGSQESGDAASGPGSPRSRVQARLDAASLEAHRKLPSFDLPHPVLPLRSATERTPIRGGSFPLADRRAAHGHEVMAVDVSQLRDQPRSQSLHRDTFSPMAVENLYHPPVHAGLSRWEREDSVNSLSFAAEGKNDDDKDDLKDENSRNEIRRRRRTRPDEANVLAAAYSVNAFPDQQTRQRLADQVGMTIRAVSVWFQNRRQAEKKRSGRYGGSGIIGGGVSVPLPGPRPSQSPAATPVKAGAASIGGGSAHATATATSTATSPTAMASDAIATAATPLRPPLASTPKNVERPARSAMPTPIDYTRSNKENIPPWASTPSDSDGQAKQADRRHNRDRPAPDATSSSTMARMGRSASRDLRDLIVAPSPDFKGDLPEKSATPQQAYPAASPATVVPLASSQKGMARVGSTPRMSLEEVLSRRSSGLQRSITERVGAHDRSSDIEDEGSSTILPPRNLISRACSTSSLSLLTTAGGRASLGSLTAQPAKSETRDTTASLNARLPAEVTVTLQRQGIIASVDEQERLDQLTAQTIWRRMESSSASSSDALGTHHDGFDRRSRRDSEEDEEKTLRMVANRRAAKAQALNRIKPIDAIADARSALHHQRPFHASPAKAATVSAGGTLGEAGLSRCPPPPLAASVGLSKRVPSLDWAAGRDRAATSALPQRTVSMPQLQVPLAAAKANLAVPAEPSPKAGQQRSEVRREVETSRNDGSATTAGPASSAPSPHKQDRYSRKTGKDGTTVSSRRSVTRTSSPTKKPLPTPIGDENVFEGGRALPAGADVSPKRRRVVSRDESGLEREKLARFVPTDLDAGSKAPPSHINPERALGSPMFVGRGMMHPHSFPSVPHPPFLSTPRSLASSPFNSSKMSLSTRSERMAYRTLAGSPSTTPASRKAAVVPESARASFQKSRVRSLQSTRESSARDQRQPLADISNAHRDPSRPPSQESASSNHSSQTSEEWAANLVKDGRILSSTPARVFGDRSNASNVTMSAERTKPNRHDDSGYFGSESEDDEQPLAATAGKPRRAFESTAQHSRWAKSKSSPVVPRKRKGGPGEAENDRQAAELLLELGGTRPSSQSQAQSQ